MSGGISVMATKRICTKCGVEKPLFGFSKQRGKHRSICKDCNSKYAMSKPIRDRRRATMMKNRYNFTIDEYNEMWEKQQGLCVVCNQPETTKHQTGVTRNLGVDHDHLTGKVRGLLCQQCNKALGDVDDSIEKLEALIEYLKKYV